MKIVVYGGSFNPPHIGHIKAAEQVAERLQPERFLIIPDYLPPHKELAEGSPSPQQRLEMCRLAFQNVPGAEITAIEMEREGRSYTSDTIAALSERFPDGEFYLVIGSDMLLSFTEWFRFEYLLERCTLTVLSRFGSDIAQLEAYAEELRKIYDARVLIIPHDPVLISSSMLRTQLKGTGKPDAISPEVYSYIRANHLYDGNGHYWK